MKLTNQTFFLIIISFLLISLIIHSKDFKGAEYRTKAAYTYGRFETRYKSPQREGVLASFFTYYDGGGIQNWNEIDIEILGRYDNDVQFNTITPNQTNHVRHQLVDFNPHLDFHIYAFEWTPDYVAWFIDGEEVYRQTGSYIQTLTREQKIMMNIWNPVYENWAGVWNPDALPAFAYYDWVSYYSFTPGSGNYGSNNNFTHQWTDNFDSWDQNRWDKATHTWDGNNCDFITANVVFKDGLMILCLTDNTNTSFTDKKVPTLLWARASEGKILAVFSEEIDETSGETISNYNILPDNIPIDSVRLREDKKSVIIFASGLNLAQSYNLLVLNIKDRSSTPNTLALKVVSIIMPQALTFPIKINAAGNSINGYIADQGWEPSVEYGFIDGSVSQISTPINGTEEDQIYQSERFGLVSYKVRVPNGRYNVKFMLAENYFNQSGLRIFDIYAENTNNQIDNVDIFNAKGKNSAYEIQLSNIQVNDEVLDIHFSAEVDNALLNGLVIENISTGSIDTQWEREMPASFTMEQNYPNPFNGTTVIKFFLPIHDNLTFNVFDMLGGEVYSKVLGSLDTGSYEFKWEGKSNKGMNLSSGTYFYSLKGKENLQVKKLILLN